MSDTQRNAV